MFGFAAIPSILQFIGFFFLPESPRWLYQNNLKSESEKVLSKIYNGDQNWIKYGFLDIVKKINLVIFKELDEIHFAHEQQLQDQLNYGN